jgi:hypothetical protein
MVLKDLAQEWRVLFPFFAVLALRKWSATHHSANNPQQSWGFDGEPP